MKYKKGDRILYNRQKFGTVNQDQFNQTEVDVVFDREKSKITAVRLDTLELVSDTHHEAVLAEQINSALSTDTSVRSHKATAKNLKSGLTGELLKLADELSTGADAEMNIFRLRTTMKEVSNVLRNIAEGL